jgi:hypothetical protein
MPELAPTSVWTYSFFPKSDTVSMFLLLFLKDLDELMASMCKSTPEAIWATTNKGKSFAELSFKFLRVLGVLGVGCLKGAV